MAIDAYGHDDVCCGEQRGARVEVEVLSAVVQWCSDAVVL